MLKLNEVTEKLIGFDTVSHKENSACTQYTANLLNDMGCEVEVFEDIIDGIPKSQILASLGPKKSGEGLLLSGHMDIVPFESQPGWQRDALKLELNDDHIIGRGTSDMKVFIAQALVAASTIESKKLKSQLTFLLTCDEEICCQGARRLVPQLKKRTSDWPLPQQALIGEPTDFGVYHAHKGVGVMKLQVLGKGGHSSRPDLGKNAIADMGRIIIAIDDFNRELATQTNPTNKELYPDWPYCSFNVGQINGGVADNMIPEKCEVTISCRSTTDMSADWLIDELKIRIKKLPLAGEVKWREVQTAPALLSSPKTKLFKELMSLTAAKSLGGAPFATDAGHFRDLDMDCYICGPGLLSQAHQANESMPRAHYESGVSFLKKIISRICLTDL